VQNPPGAVTTQVLSPPSALTTTIHYLYVCAFVTPGILSSKRLNLGSRKQRHTIALRLKFSAAEDLGEIRTGAPNAGRVG